jgi:hypothetical protein
MYKRLSLSLLICLMLMLASQSIFAQSNVLISIDEINIEVGATTTIDVKVACETNCGATDVVITFDPNIIQVSNLVDGGFLGSTGNNVFPVASAISADRLQYAVVTLNTGNAAATGDGVLFRFNVTGLTEGDASLTFAQAEITDLNGAIQTVSTQLGSLTVGDETIVTPEPTTLICQPIVPEQLIVGQAFTVSLECQGVPTETGVYGAQVCHDLSGDLAIAQATQHSAGTIFTGQDVLDPINSVTDAGGCYGASLIGNGNPVSGSFTIATADYQAAEAGTITVSLRDVILASREGISIGTPIINTAQIIVVEGDLASLEGDARRQAGPPNGFAISFESINATSITPNGEVASFLFDNNLPAGDGLLTASAPGHLSCEVNVSLQAGINTLTEEAYLLAGDSNSDGMISIIDSTSLGLAFAGSPNPGYVTDFNEDGSTNVLDLVFVGNNYGVTGPTACWN